MRTLDLFGMFFHWLGGLLGVLGCLFGFAALPGLFDVVSPSNLLFTILEIPFSMAILDAFPFTWQVVILGAGVFLYAWLCFLFLFSTHILVTAFLYTPESENDGSATAWIVVLFLAVVLSMLFILLLYGFVINKQTLAVALLILAITSYLFAANYTVSDEGEPHVISYS